MRTTPSLRSGSSRLPLDRVRFALGCALVGTSCMLAAAGCAPSTDATNDEAAVSEDALSTKPTLNALRTALFTRVDGEQWFRCTAGTGAGRIAFHVTPQRSSHRVTAIFSGQDYNRTVVPEVTADVGFATLDLSNPDRRIFRFEVDGKAVALDIAFQGPARLTFDGAVVPASCQDFDSPFEAYWQ